MADKSIDQGHRALEELSVTYRRLTLEDASEADTRAKVIDQFLTDVLGWAEADMKREERATEDGTTKFVDYVLRTATTTILIEAKRAEAAFTLPRQRQSGRLGGWLSAGEVGEAIRQARDYCRVKGIPFAAVTNGSAWVVFPAVRVDAISFEDSHARVFRSIADIEKRFIEFWELLSRQRVVEGSLQDELLDTRKQSESHRLLAVVKEPGYRLGRNALFEHIESAVDKALSDEAILDDPDALENCYVKTSERIRFDKRLNMYLTDPKPVLERPTIRARSRKSKKEVEDTITGETGPTQKFILLLGPVGAGKSTFLAYTRQVSAKSLIDGKLLWFRVDFKLATASDSPRQFIYQDLLRQIETDQEFDLGDWEHSIRPAYREDVAKLERGVLRPLKDSDPEGFERKISDMIFTDREKVEPYVEHIVRKALQKHRGYLVIDNVDQLETDEAQTTTFVEAQAIARRLGISVIMSLRDSTYLRHRNTPVFDAFQIEALFIDSPNVIPVLSRRFAYAHRLLAGRGARITTDAGATIYVPELGAFFDIVSRSMLSDDAGFMLEVLSGSDIRRGLQLAKAFLASGHTNADKALQSYISGRPFTFPAHEVFRGVVLGPRRHYREEESLLLNLLDAKLNRKTTSLLRLHLTSYLARRASEPGFDGLPYQDLVDEVQRTGIPASDVQKACGDLVGGRVLRTGDGLGIADDSVLLPTRLAGYLIRELAWQFQYLDICVVDANIYEQEAYDELTGLTRRIESTTDVSSRLNLRLERVTRFLAYLRLIEETWTVECKRRGLDERLARPVVAEELIPMFRDREIPRVRESNERRTQASRTERR